MDRDSTITQMLQNHKADSWADTKESDDSVAATVPLYDDERATKLERLDAYVDHCFETYPIVYNWLGRDEVQCCVVDWDFTRGQARKNCKMRKREFPSRISKKWYHYSSGTHVLLMATALVGAPPEADNGVGWKATVRHELGHIVDYAKRGQSDHGPKFKSIMRQFGEPKNDGTSCHGKRPDMIRY